MQQLQGRNVRPLDAFTWIKHCIATLSEMYLSDGAVGGKNYLEVFAELEKGEPTERTIIFLEELGRHARSMPTFTLMSFDWC